MNLKAKLYACWAIVTGANSSSTPVSTIHAQLHEPRPLPIGMTEFEEWSDRIISGAMLTADAESQKFALANELLQLKPTEDHKEDIYFIKLLRKFAVNQIADAARVDIREKVKARLAAEEVAKAQLSQDSIPSSPSSTPTQGS